tara:strand:+ start:163 stop:1254 length:1092 start_codon:yes stop_codon:yes gene_type:complete
MKRIKAKYYITVLLFSVFLDAEKFDNYFQDIFESEKIDFNQCVMEEGLPPEKRLNTKCKYSERAKKAFYILENEMQFSTYNMLPEFSKYQTISKMKLRFPRAMQERNEMGYVILNFDIDIDGNTKNITVDEGMCGNMHSPFAKFKPCSGFNKVAIDLIKRTKYKPASFLGKNIVTENAKYRMRFILDGAELSIKKSSHVKKYKRVLNLIENKNFEAAMEIALENKKYENEFLFELARIQFILGNHSDAISYLNEFLLNIEDEKDEIPESMLVGAVSIMIESLFNLENYEKIIELSITTDKYLINNKAFEEVLAISYLYIGASYVNLSNLETGLFYLTRSKRMSKNEGQIKYIENFINNVTNYL